MRKTSELLKLASNDPQYLFIYPYLCSVAIWLQKSEKITLEEFTVLTDAIRGSLDGHTFLRSYLRNYGLIEHWHDEETSGYSVHARLHWDTLIMTYEAEGD